MCAPRLRIKIDATDLWGAFSGHCTLRETGGVACSKLCGAVDALDFEDTPSVVLERVAKPLISGGLERFSARRSVKRVRNLLKTNGLKQTAMQ